MYISTALSAKLRAPEGNQMVADYILNCSYFEYYFRAMIDKQRADTIKQQMDAIKNKSATSDE